MLKTIEEYEHKRIVEIVKEVSKVNKNENLSDGEKNEAKNALMMTGSKLYQFITKGGKVDVSKEDGERKVFNNFQLVTNYQEVRKLETRVQKLLNTRSQSKEEQAEKTEAEPKVQLPKYRKNKKR